MSLHIVHFIGPINHHSACTIRNLCLQALQSGATEIELHMSTEGGNMTAGFALYFFLKSLPVPLTTHNLGSIESVGVVIFLDGRVKRYACPGTRFLVHPLHWGFGNLVAADHSRVSANGATASTSTPSATPAPLTRPPLDAPGPCRYPPQPVRQRAPVRRRRRQLDEGHDPRNASSKVACRRCHVALVERVT